LKETLYDSNDNTKLWKTALEYYISFPKTVIPGTLIKLQEFINNDENVKASGEIFYEIDLPKILRQNNTEFDGTSLKVFNVDYSFVNENSKYITRFSPDSALFSEINTIYDMPKYYELGKILYDIIQKKNSENESIQEVTRRIEALQPTLNAADSSINNINTINNSEQLQSEQLQPEQVQPEQVVAKTDTQVQEKSTAVGHFSPSFDCSKASTIQEKLICSDEELAMFDAELSELYKQCLERLEDKESLKENQRNWLRFRNQCENKECLFGAYQEQIIILSEELSGI
jgi:uncharacterized protein YecT (DUF1311 family)